MSSDIILIQCGWLYNCQSLLQNPFCSSFKALSLLIGGLTKIMFPYVSIAHSNITCFYTISYLIFQILWGRQSRCFYPIFWTTGSQNMVPGPAASVPPRNLLEMWTPAPPQTLQSQMFAFVTSFQVMLILLLLVLDHTWMKTTARLKWKIRGPGTYLKRTPT